MAWEKVFLWLITWLFQVFSHLQCSKVSPKRSVKILYCGKKYDRDFENKSSDEFYFMLIPPRRPKCTFPLSCLKRAHFDKKNDSSTFEKFKAKNCL